MNKLYLLLILLPVSWALALFHASPILQFFVTSLAIVPLAGLIGHSTEELSKRTGATIGGLLNATFGNLTEMILAFIAVSAGQVELVRASLVGSIVGNILLVLGLSYFLGGLKHKVQSFNQDMAEMHAAMMFLAVGCMAIPTIFIKGNLFPHGIPTEIPLKTNTPFELFSLGVAAVLVIMYLASLLFSLRTHEDLFRGGEPPYDPPHWSVKMAAIVLAAASIFVAVQSELLVHSFEPATKLLHFSPAFVGLILIPIIGNAAEHASAVSFALKNQMDISMNICSSSSAQIAMFVAPLAVLFSPLLGHPMGFNFTIFELVAVGLATVTIALLSLDGKSNWFEGAQLLALYLILGLAFFFVR